MLFGQYGNAAELIFLRQLAEGNGLVYLQMTLLAALLLLAVLRPEQIRYPTLFKWSFLTLIASVITPYLLDVALGVAVSMDMFATTVSRYGRANNSDVAWLMQSRALTAPGLVSIAMLLTFMSLAIGQRKPGPRKPPATDQPPPKHPLD